MADDSYAWLSATDTARQVAAKSLDPQAVVRSHLSSIGLHDPTIHAFVYVDRAASAAPGPLSGVTLAVKDNLPVAGMPWTDGSAVWRDRIPTEDDVPVARARAAGAAILGKTNLPELAAAVGTTNAIFPPTNNPWRAGITPGGSSGGSAAAVGAGMASVGMGTDMGGSIRIPASCCGVVGLRPSPDRVPTESTDPAGLSVVGPIAKTVADVRLMFSVMSQSPAPPHDFWHVSDRHRRLHRVGHGRRLRRSVPSRGRCALGGRPSCRAHRLGVGAGGCRLRSGAAGQHGVLPGGP